VVFGLALGTAYTFMGRISRVLQPLVAGYCWEFTITLLGALAILLRQALGGRRGVLPTLRDLGWIVLYCIPGGIGTACYALAVAGGPVAVVAAVLSTMMVACSVLAWLTHGERLPAGQWACICLVCGAIVGMKVYG
jgi:drug/metabolite transporter (DMT)-like permease